MNVTVRWVEDVVEDGHAGGRKAFNFVVFCAFGLCVIILTLNLYYKAPNFLMFLIFLVNGYYLFLLFGFVVPTFVPIFDFFMLRPLFSSLYFPFSPCGFSSLYFPLSPFLFCLNVKNCILTFQPPFTCKEAEIKTGRSH